MQDSSDFKILPFPLVPSMSPSDNSIQLFPGGFTMIIQTLRLARRPYIAFIVILMALCQSCLAGQAAIEKRATLEAEMKYAMNDVRAIVNSPVNALARSPEMRVSTYSPGWFHEGAIKPDFNNVDVRATQETQYGQHEFVTSNLNAGLVWLGSQVEFNPMTKYFYTDYKVPKKKLTESEMLEINRLYRIIGRCEQELARLQGR
jgi:hypothetical protein